MMEAITLFWQNTCVKTKGKKVKHVEIFVRNIGYGKKINLKSDLNIVGLDWFLSIHRLVLDLLLQNSIGCSWKITKMYSSLLKPVTGDSLSSSLRKPLTNPEPKSTTRIAQPTLTPSPPRFHLWLKIKLSCNIRASENEQKKCKAVFESHKPYYPTINQYIKPNN